MNEIRSKKERCDIILDIVYAWFRECLNVQQPGGIRRKD